jgi:pimeloyl-ACP methyl ester carboxylesterase
VARQCARLIVSFSIFILTANANILVERKVPLNYSDPNGEKAIIALTRKASLIPRKSPLYRGPVLFNPGGPGGSGIDLVLQYGDALGAILGPQFDVVGFDPRG